ncbi:MAG: LysR family transcriptional regulator [Lachnospiraceae bacterium]|nr:LysR family transcriptional regulator [Lachnospiraceae bacterium]
METKNIQEFLALAKLGSSYSAAEKTFVSQSSLVRHIQSMEEEFGVPLFDRTRRGFTLNANGKLFLPYAEKIAMLQAQCYQELHPEEKSPDVIRVAAEGKIIELIIDFKKEYPDYVINYQKSDDIETELRTGGVEVAFLSTMTSSHEDLISIPFYKEEVLAVLYEGHPLAERESVHLEELKNENFVSLCDDVVFDETFLERYRKVGFTRKLSVSVPVGTDMIRMVKEGLGITLIHGDAETVPVYPGVKIIPLEPRMQYEVRMCYRNDVPLSKAAGTFVNFAKRWRTHFKEINLSFDAVF